MTGSHLTFFRDAALPTKISKILQGKSVLTQAVLRPCCPITGHSEADVGKWQQRAAAAEAEVKQLKLRLSTESFLRNQKLKLERDDARVCLRFQNIAMAAHGDALCASHNHNRAQATSWRPRPESPLRSSRPRGNKWVSSAPSSALGLSQGLRSV